MKEHVLSKHEKNTPFKCDKCDRSYGTNKQLSKHQILVHERVNCDECGKEICNSFILKRHKASAHGILPKDYHQCEECPSFFSSETSWINMWNQSITLNLMKLQKYDCKSDLMKMITSYPAL